MLVELLKKGSSSLVSNYRDVLLADDNGKAAAKLIRGRLFDIALEFSDPTQYGCGLNGGKTAFGHLHVRMFLDSRKALGLSGSVLFVDVVAAFASLLRRIIFNINSGDEQWLQSLRDTGFSEEDISFIYAHITDIPWFTNRDGEMCCNHGIAMAQQSYTNNWFTQESLTGVVCVSKGSAAGTPLADIVYSLAMSRLINLLIQSLHNEDIHALTYVNTKSIYFRPASFHDDLMIPIAAKADKNIDKTMKAVTVSVYVSNLFGFN